jgi:hypothetical protein
VGNMEWRAKFPTYEVVNGDPRHSDHRPIIVHMQGEQAGNAERMGPSVFKFEANWLKEDKCVGLVQEAWVNSFQFGASSVSEGLKDISRVMMDWSKNILGDLEKRIKKLKKELTKCIKGATVARECSEGTCAKIQTWKIRRTKGNLLETTISC